MGFEDQFAHFHDIASKATGLTNFGTQDYLDPMHRMLADLDRYSGLDEAGAEMVAGEVIGRLVSRLIVAQGIGEHPGLDEVKIERPIFIIGMARSGTTALLRLLSADPNAQGLELWLGAMPMPRPPRETWESYPAFQQIQSGLEALFKIHPEILRMHPMSASKPDECRFAMDHSFWSPGAMNTTNLPDYGKWVLETDATYAYRYYRRILALIGGTDKRQWVLKDPSHLFGIDSLLRIFPDACIVQTHRSLVKSMGSMTSSIWGLRHAREPALTRTELGRQMSDVWLPSLEKMEIIRQRSNPAQFFDLHIDEIQANPAASVERIFEYFGLPISEASRAAWRHHAATDPRAGHAKHDFDAAEYGIDDADLRARALNYTQRFDKVTASCL